MNIIQLKKRRIFIALTISAPLQETILNWQKKYVLLPVRWLKGKNLHITFIPPWYERNVPEIKEKINKIKARPFEIKFTQVVYGPDSKRPRLIWASGIAPKEALTLKAGLEKTLDRKAELRPWLTHLTLARFRPRDFPGFPLKILNEQVIWQERFSSLVLMESMLSSQGADYHVLEEFKLE